MRTTVLETSTEYPVTWETVKQHLRVEELGEQEDAEKTLVMDTYVAAAARSASQILRRALIATKYETICYPRELKFHAGFLSLQLPWPDLLSVEGVWYGDTELTEDVDYKLAATGEGFPTSPGTLIFSAGLFGWSCCGGCSCDATLDELTSAEIRVDYTGGYGETAEDIPGNVRAWILLRTGALYQNREETTETRSIEPMPFMNDLLLDRVFRFS